MRNKTFPLHSVFFCCLRSFFNWHKNILIRNNHKKANNRRRERITSRMSAEIKVIKTSPTLTAFPSLAFAASTAEIINSQRVTLIFTRARWKQNSHQITLHVLHRKSRKHFNHLISVRRSELVTLVELSFSYLFTSLIYLGETLSKGWKYSWRKMLECEVNLSFSGSPETNSYKATYLEKFMIFFKFIMDEHKNIFRHSREL